jgi:UPF0176 protein
MQHEVILFYRYVTLPDPEGVRARLLASATAHELRGRILVAEEGINGTVEGTPEELAGFERTLLAEPEFADIAIKRSAGTGNAFPKLSVKVRDEIVGTRFTKEVDPRVETAPRITAEELRSWYESGKAFEIVDMRNDYEYASGHFRGSINPRLGNSRDLPEAVTSLEGLKGKTVLTVCTGGVRCEKMSALLMKEGFRDVYQLDNGIHGYMQAYPGKDFLGTLYTFDERVTMDFGGEREIVGTCMRCDAKTETYVNCAYDPCHLHFLVCETCNVPGVYCSQRCEALASGKA